MTVADLESATTVDRAVEEMRRALFDGELSPGTPLREVALAESLNVSRSTVREALAQLVAEGLADRIAHKGTVVRRLDRSAVTDICAAREIVEAAGIDAWATAAESDRAAVRAALAAFSEIARQSARPASVTAAHLAIHRSLVALTRNERILATADSLYAELRLALAVVDRVRQDLDEQITSHERLLALIEAGDYAAARAELADHLAGARESLIATLGT